jgi:prepilin-type processing-associated H-X9-DG protein
LFWNGTTIPAAAGALNTGVILTGAQINIQGITDGTSNTLLVSETCRWNMTGSDDRRGRMFNTYQGETFFSTLYAPNTATADAQFSCGANLPAYLPCTAVGGGANSINSARSMHNGRAGVNAAFADGTVKFVVNSINIGTWNALGTRAGGETVDISGM